jgi:hypothetical protein
MPNSVSMSTGSVFAGWVMHRTGRFKTLNLTFGIFPTIGATLISLMREDSGPIQSWLSIVRNQSSPLLEPVYSTGTKLKLG